MALKKTEQTVLDRIKSANDEGRSVNTYSVVEKTKGTVGSWKRNFGRREGQKPKKAEQDALQSLIDSGLVQNVQGRLFVANHPALQTVAARIDLMSRARQVDQKAIELAEMQAIFDKDQALVREWWGK
jgi:hypothetical protein